MGSNVKRLVHAEIKSADKGIVELVFATFNTIDHDGDVTEPGAFDTGVKVPVSAYNHTSWDGALPVGIAELGPHTQEEARASAQFFMDTPEGKSTFTAVKRLSESGLGEWSYGYDPIEYRFGEVEGTPVRFLSKQKVFEVSPVLRGAGLGTRTVAAKARGETGETVPNRWLALPEHDTSYNTKAWRPGEVARGVALTAGVSALRSMHALVDPTIDPARKAAYALMHHDAPRGPANIRACLMGLAALNAGIGPVLDDAAKAGAYAHLAAHLREAERSVPELKTATGTLKFGDQVLVLLAQVTALTDRAAEVGTERRLAGKTGLTRANIEVLSWLGDELGRLREMIDSPRDLELREVARSIALLRGVQPSYQREE